jgi:hypothetical protein
LETFFRNSPLPAEILQGNLRSLVHPIRTEVAQPDGVLKNVSDFWGALENQLRPSVALVVTLDLDLEQIESYPLVLARVLKFGSPRVQPNPTGGETLLSQLEPGWEAGPVQLGGEVRDNKGKPIPGASVRLMSKQGGQPVQVGVTVQADSGGRYRFASVPAGEYTLVVEFSGQAPVHRLLKIAVSERGQPMPELVFPVEVPM